jgi:uncharacterized membrane protein
MPHSDAADSANPENGAPGQGLAVTAESLYLINLLVLPGIGFLILVYVYYKNRNRCPPLAGCHLQQTLTASLWGGLLLVVANALIILLGGYTAPMTWTIVILYFTICHSTLVMLGMIGLAKALAGRIYIYPLLGRPCND